MNKKALFVPIFALLTAGCGWQQVTPDRADTTAPRLRFAIYYEGAALNSPITERVETSSSDFRANRCVYVNSPFRVNAVAFDDGGIRRIIVGPVFSTRGIRARNSEPNDIIVGTTPSASTQPTAEGPTPNPGIWGKAVSVDYEEGPVYNAGSLFAVYELDSSEPFSFRAQARNFKDPSGTQAEIWDYWVQRAGPGNPPGTPCSVPGIN